MIRSAASTFKRIAEPIKVGPMVAKNRIWFAPCWTRFASVNGEVTQQLIDHYVARARGGVGLITQEATAVDGNHIWFEPQIGIWDDKFAPALHRLVEAVHMYDVPIIAQFHHSGMFGTDPVAPSRVSCFDHGCLHYIQPRALSIAEIEEIRDKFIAAAVRAKEVGYDGVELHGATAYLLEQFFSPHNNRRDDKYGGSLENRMLFPLEIVRGIRAQCGPDYPLIYTLVDTDFVPGGITSEDSIIFAKALEREGVSIIDFQINGTYETFHLSIAPGHLRRQKKGQFDITEKYKKELRIPVTTRGCGEYNPATWEDALERGAVDAVRTGRQLLADPDMPNKVLEGKLEDIRSCLLCVECLERGVNRKWQCACTVNYGMGRGERPVERAPVSKKVLVIGGGPGGLEAARVAAERGHDVTLMEKAPALGGTVIVAAQLIAKEILMSFCTWAERQCRNLGVKIELEKEVTPKVVKDFKPDAVIVATGAVPAKPPIPGIEQSKVVTADEILMGKTRAGKRVVVAGGEMVGMEVADYILEKGLASDVTVIDRGPMSSIAEGMPSLDKANFMTQVVPQIGVKIVTDMQVEEITDKGVVAIDKRWQKHLFEADTVVLALGYRSERSIYDDLKGSVRELYLIGDAVSPRNMLGAIHEAAYFASQM